MKYKNKQRTKTKIGWMLTAVILVATVGSGGYFFMQNRSKSNQKAQAAGATPAGQPKSVKGASTKPKTTRFIASGDAIAHDAINLSAKQAGGGYDYNSMVADLKPIFATGDIRFCNQATEVGGADLGVSGYPDFNAPFQFDDMLRRLGCNLINTASNHSSDKPVAALNANVDYWAQQSGMLAVAGQYKSQEAHDAIKYFEVDGLKYAFLAYSTYTNHPVASSYSVGMYSRDYASSQIKAAKAAGAKFIVVSMRWGTEYSQTINTAQTAEAQFLADQGVQLILGHGTHVLEPVKWLDGAGGNKTLVWYSLGNLLHAQLEPETLFNGLAVMEIDPATATIKSSGFFPTYQHYDWTAEQAAKQDLLARHNFQLVPLEDADPLFAKAQLKTTIAAQKERLKDTLNTYTDMPFLTKKDLLNN